MLRQNLSAEPAYRQAGILPFSSENVVLLGQLSLQVMRSSPAESQPEADQPPRPRQAKRGGLAGITISAGKNPTNNNKKNQQKFAYL